MSQAPTQPQEVNTRSAFVSDEGGMGSHTKAEIYYIGPRPPFICAVDPFSTFFFAKHDTRCFFTSFFASLKVWFDAANARVRVGIVFSGLFPHSVSSLSNPHAIVLLAHHHLYTELNFPFDSYIIQVR